MVNFLSLLRVPSYIFWYMKNEKGTSFNLKKIQEKKLRRIVHHAYKHVPYYHHLYKKAGINPEGIKSLNDLEKLPLVSKTDFQENWDHFLSNTIDPQQCKTFSTSGTSGMPVKILKDKSAIDLEYAMIYYAFFECGMGFSDRFLDISINMPKVKKAAYRHGPLGLMKAYYLLTRSDPVELVNEIQKIKPTVIYAFPTLIELLLEDYGSVLKEVKPKLVFTQGEKLSQKQKTLVERFWGIKPNETYGSREFPRIAFECNDHQGLHVLSDNLILELINDGTNVSPNEEGETIVTGLYNFTMPLIRYKLGDIAKWADHECSCGRKWPLLKSIEGRFTAILTLPSGRRIFGHGVVSSIKKLVGEKLKRFQILFQQSKTHFTVKLLLYKNMEAKKEFLEKKVIQGIRNACFNEEVIIEVFFVDSIPPLPSGKNPAFILET